MMVDQNTSNIRPNNAIRSSKPYLGCLKYTAWGNASTSGSISLMREGGGMIASLQALMVR
ncbi:MAG TPA: hypothetical protein VKM55_24985 [Candidatus Lokiarchaeia archaeon]|nr:hypothetical protein [Candidatus Lokiarchaeia archaeon]